MNDYSLDSENLLGARQGWAMGKDRGEVQEDRKFMVQQVVQSPGEKDKADLCDDLIQGYPQTLTVHAI